MKQKWTEEKTQAAWKRADRQIDATGVEQFVHPSDLIDAAENPPVVGGIEIGAALMLRILAWIARGHLGAEEWGQRAWVAAYYLRNDLVRGKSAREFAKQCGIKPQNITKLMAKWRAEFSEIEWPDSRSRNGKRKAPGQGISLPPSA